MTAVVQGPHTSNNPTDAFRVVLYEDWMAYLAGELRWVPVQGTYTTRAEADEERNRLNAAEISGHKPVRGGKAAGKCDRCIERATVRLTLRTASTGKIIRRMVLCTKHGGIEDQRARGRRTVRLESEPIKEEG
jgi:hypothetical protein